MDIKFTWKDFLHWAIAVLSCTLGVSLCTKASFGLSMIAAVPYTIHLWLREAAPWYTQGTSEYFFQALLLLFICLVVRRFRWKYLLSFGTGVICGFCIDGWLWLLGGNGPYELLWVRILAFAVGVTITGLALALFFRTSWPLQVYELAVSEISDRFGWKLEKVKLANDLIYLALAVALSLLCTGTLTGAGVGIGTVLITFVNAPLMTLFGRILDKLKL